MCLSSRHEHDHFPIQWVFGGEGIVPVCVNCHDLKDRIPVSNWPYGAAIASFEEVCETLVPPGEIEWRSSREQLPRGYPHWLMVHLRWVAVKDTWISLSPIARLLVAKLLVIDQAGKQNAWQTWTSVDDQAELVVESMEEPR